MKRKFNRWVILGVALSSTAFVRTEVFHWGSADRTWKGNFAGSPRADIASAAGGKVYLNASDGTGFISTTWTVDDKWGKPSVTWVADFNGDHKADIASANGLNVY